MNNADIVRMANQIADFFKSYGAEEAKKEIATHINNYWDPRLREQFFKTLNANDEGFDLLVVAAAALVRKPLEKQTDIPEAKDHITGLPKEAKEA